MFDEPTEDPAERLLDPKKRASEKAEGFRFHAEIAAVFEACRKFDAKLRPSLDATLARDIQRSMARLEKAKTPASPILPQESNSDAAAVLDQATAANLSTNDYHIHRRPGEVMMIRWLVGAEVETFYQRLQAHFDAAFKAFKDDERQSLEWKKDAATLAYLDALDGAEIKMADRYLREPIREHHVFVLSTQTADELNIAYLCDYVMGVSPAALVGAPSAPPDNPTEQELAWFYKLFALRGMHGGSERMCFFTYLQKAGDSEEDSW
jgi:hypothetical protein